MMTLHVLTYGASHKKDRSIPFNINLWDTIPWSMRKKAEINMYTQKKIQSNNYHNVYQQRKGSTKQNNKPLHIGFDKACSGNPLFSPLQFAWFS